MVPSSLCRDRKLNVLAMKLVFCREEKWKNALRNLRLITHKYY